MKLLSMVFMIVCTAIGLQGQSVSNVIDLIQNGKVTEAQTLLAQLEQHNGKQPDLLFLKGMLAKSAEDARLLYESIVKEFPKSSYTPKARYRLAQLKYAQGLYKTALQYFQTIIQSADQDKLTHESLYWASQCHLAMNRQDSAVVYLERLLLQSPSLELVILAQKELTSLNVNSPFASDFHMNPSPQNDSQQRQPVLSPVNETKQITHEIMQETDNSTPLITPEVTDSSPAFTVQIGAYSNRNNALARQDFFEKRGYRTQIVQREGSQTLYLVWVGAFDNEKDARSLAEELHNKFETLTTLIRN